MNVSCKLSPNSRKVGVFIEGENENEEEVMCTPLKHLLFTWHVLAPRVCL